MPPPYTVYETEEMAVKGKTPPYARRSTYWVVKVRAGMSHVVYLPGVCFYLMASSLFGGSTFDALSFLGCLLSPWCWAGKSMFRITLLYIGFYVFTCLESFIFKCFL